MEPDPNRRGHLPSRVPLMTLFETLVQKILCPTSLVFSRPARKYQEEAKALMNRDPVTIGSSCGCMGML